MRIAGKAKRFYELSWSERWTFVSAATLSPTFWFGLRVLGLQRFKALLERPAIWQRARPSIGELSAFGALINAAANNGPGTSTCLSRSLLLCWLLRRRGVDTDLRIGVRIEGDQLKAHAWVEYQGVPINDAVDIGARFAAFDQPLSPEDFV